ncbi:MAG: putative toxin-antitoxin system toxin component, PIN family [Planctomycetia bacterium]|nr:putative toxin-antitoxin system toxin component, PIN family [Planctomycetia bacterium]
MIIAGVLSSSPRSASRAVLDRHRTGDFLLVLSPDTLREIRSVLAHSELRAVHGMTDADIRHFCRALQVASQVFPGSLVVPPAVTRDLTDTKWVALALESGADFLVTNDQRHLHRLKAIGRTRIATPARFLRELAQKP